MVHTHKGEVAIDLQKSIVGKEGVSPERKKAEKRDLSQFYHCLLYILHCLGPCLAVRVLRYHLHLGHRGYINNAFVLVTERFLRIFHIELSDDVIPEYVMVMVTNDKVL